MKKSHLALVVLALLATACCEDRQCPAFDNAERDRWMPDAPGTTLSFRNPGDLSAVTFTVDRNEATATYTERSKGGGLGCNVDDCEAGADLRWTSADTAITGPLTLSVRSSFVGEEALDRLLSYKLDDFQRSFRTYPLLSLSQTEASPLWERDSIVDNLILGSHTYGYTIIQTRNAADTSRPYRISKVYLSPGLGVIGFISRGKLYCRP